LCVQLPCVVDVEGVNVVMWSRRSRRLRLRLRPLFTDKRQAWSVAASQILRDGSSK
jgi:hypothetical protein